jgi:hypothetical protein
VTLRFSYHRFKSSHPLSSLRGRTRRPRPIINVTLIGPTGAILRPALLDTGADDTVFPESVASAIGIDLAASPASSGMGIGLNVMPLRYAEVTFRIADNQERREWQGWVGFTSGRLRHAMLGFAGFLEFFTATFHGDREEVELTVNGSYPGT